MGSAFVAVSDDATAMYWNPSGITKVENFSVAFDHTEWFADLAYNYVAAAYSLGGFGTVGVSFTSSDYGDMKVTTIDQPNGTGEMFSVSDVSFSLAYAINLTDNFSIGISPKVVSQSIWKMNAVGFGVDLGVQYVTPFDGAVLAMSISNFGSKMELSGSNTDLLIDMDLDNDGTNDKTPASLLMDEWALPLNFRVGVSYQPIRLGQHVLTLAVEAMHPNDNYESVNVGGEYAFSNFLFLRGGYKSLFLDKSEEGLTLGMGLKQNLLGNVAIIVDYAYQDFGRLGDIQKFTLGVNF
jgi:opacity protein-like surface antigen